MDYGFYESRYLVCPKCKKMNEIEEENWSPLSDEPVNCICGWEGHGIDLHEKITSYQRPPIIDVKIVPRK